MHSSPRSQWAISAARLDCVPVGKKSPASMPKRSAQTSCRRFTVGSSPKTSSPTSAEAMAWRMPGEGWVTVSERRSMAFMAPFYNLRPTPGGAMKLRSKLGIALMLAAGAALADYDPKMEAKEAAQRKAAQEAEAKKKAEAQKKKSDAEQQMMRGMLGKEAEGKTDAQVKVLYDAKMGDYMKQAREAEKMYGGKK